MMRISLVMVTGGAGGLQQSIIPYATALRRFGHAVQLIMNARSPLLGDVLARGFSPDLVYGSPTRPMMSFLGVRSHLRRFAPDAVIGFASKGYPVARWAARKGTPVLTRLGSMDPKKIKKLLGASVILATSAEMQELVVKLGQPPSGVKVVPNFLADDLAVEPKQKSNRMHIGSMGRLVYRKGFDVLLQAASLLRQRGYEFDLSIAGSGNEEEALHASAKELDVPVNWLGWIENERKSNFLRSLDVFVCPSREEPFGQIYLDAMRFSLPVVTTDTVGARAIFTPGVDCCVIPPGDPDAMAKNLAALFDDDRLRERLGQAGAENFARTFHVAAAGRKLCDTLAELIKNPSSGQSR